MIETTKAKPLVEQALAARGLRQDIIASNIANIDTPFYKSKDVDFESALVEKAKQMYGGEYESKKRLRLARTDGEHFGRQNLKMYQTHTKHYPGLEMVSDSRGNIFLRDGHMARNDANTVDLDVETSEMSKNAIMINALTQALKKQSAIFKSVIEASSKV